MIDFFRALVGSRLKSVSIQSVRSHQTETLRPDENFQAHFVYEDGSVCNLLYTSGGNKALPKEFVEVHWDGKSVQIDDFSTLSIFGTKPKKWTCGQDKGHFRAMQTFFQAVAQNRCFPIPWDQIYETTLASVELDHEVWGNLSHLCGEC